MSELPIPQVRSERLVPCPECGKGFVPRGLATHRRMSHGISAAAVAPGMGNAAELSLVLESLACLRRALESLSGVLLKMDDRLGRIEAERSGEARAADPDSLERGLEDVLAEITRVREETDRQLAEWGGSPKTDEHEALAETSFTKLAELRKRQASLVYRIRELKAVESGDAACL